MEQRLGQIDIVAWQRPAWQHRSDRADLPAIALGAVAALSASILAAGAVVDPDPPLLARQFASAAVIAALALLVVRVGVWASRRRRRF